MGGGSRSSRSNTRKTLSENQKLTNNDTTNELPKKRVFISFHMENEAQIKLLRHQAKSNRFDLEFTDYSVKEPFDDNWKRRCEERIKQSSVVVCMFGEDTYKRPAVLWELKKAQELGKPTIGVRIHKDSDHLVPGPLLKKNSKIIGWNLKEIQDAIENKEDGKNG